MVKVGEEITVAYGVYYQGYDLSNLTGTVVDTDSYVIAWIPTLKIRVKLFQNEIIRVVDPDPFSDMKYFL